jgi:hypothetical protein
MGAKKTVERGYGANHKRLRRLWESRVALGDVACARCGRLIVPGSPWDLGHSDFDLRSIRVQSTEDAIALRRAAGAALFVSPLLGTQAVLSLRLMTRLVASIGRRLTRTVVSGGGRGNGKSV